MNWSTEWVLLIASRGDAEYTPLGTGTVVGPNRVLTARHVVFKNGQPVTDLVVRAKPVTDLLVRAERGDWSRPATIAWSGSDTLDVAVLEVELEGMAPSHPLALLSDGDIKSGSEWEAHGYPAVRESESDSEPSNRRESVRGRTCSYQKGHDRVNLDVSARPEKFNGLSGGAVVVEGRIVGVVRAVPADWGNGRLEATPVASFLHEPGFRRALGLDGQEDQLQKDLQALEATIAERLQKSPLFARALANKLPPSDLSSVASRVVGASGKDIAMALAEVYAAKDRAAEDREIVRSLLWQILPLALDWRSLLLQVRQSLADGANAVELPLRTETIAEIVLAGVDGRHCQFAIGGIKPQGVARVAMPASAYAPFFDSDGERLVEGVVLNLCQEGDAADPRQSYWKRLKQGYPDPAELRTVVETKLKKLARKDSHDYLPHYLLFIDKELRAGSDKDVGEPWAGAKAAFSKALPSLRLVRLKGDGATLLAEEFEISDSIRDVLERL